MSQHKMTPVVIYDGECSFCRRQVKRIQEMNRGSRSICYIPSQSDHLLERYPALVPFEGQEGMRFVDEKGRATVGCDAVIEIGRRLPKWGWIHWPYKIPPLRWGARRAYQWVARNRYRWNPPCENDQCKMSA